MVKVKGQGHQVKKRDVYDFLASVPVYKMLAYGVTLWCNVTSRYDIMMSSVFLLWDRFGTWEVQQHFSVFLSAAMEFTFQVSSKLLILITFSLRKLSTSSVILNFSEWQFKEVLDANYFHGPFDVI